MAVFIEVPDPLYVGLSVSFDLARKASLISVQEPSHWCPELEDGQSREFFTRWTLVYFLGSAIYRGSGAPRPQNSSLRTLCRSKVMAWHVSRGVERQEI